LRDTAAVPMGEIADPARPPPGCAFHPRCPFVADRCRTERPELRVMADGHWSACHRSEELTLAGVT
jgi:oligopeptide/dipeptide ABC transporter ATP-binding protein